MGLNGHFPHGIVFADSEYFKLALQSLYIYQGYQKVRLFMGSVRKQDRTSKIMRVLKDNVDLLAGDGQCPMEHPKECEKT